MNSKNVLFVLLLVLILPANSFALSSNISSNDELSDFNDVKPSDWYYNDVMEAKKLGFIEGMGNNKYEPSQTITYGQFITTLVKVISEEDVEDIQGSKHWADKYVEHAQKLGVFENGEIVKTEKGYGIKDVVSMESHNRDKIVDLDTAILRQDMMRYACKILKIYYVKEKDIFFDAPPYYTLDNFYVSTAYLSYLTEGIGRDEYGYKLFGFNKTATRAELATTLLHVKAYKEDSYAYRKEKAEIREQKEKAYQISMLKTFGDYEQGDENKFRVENGFKIPKDTIVFNYGREVLDYGTFDLVIRARFDSLEDKLEVRNIITSKFGEEVGNKIMEIMETKNKDTGEYKDVPLTQIKVKDNKIIGIGDVEYNQQQKHDYTRIVMDSLNGNPFINVRVIPPTE